MSSNETFSFDNAAPVVADSSQNDSIESSGIHSSQDGSYSQVTSVARSESVKRPGPPIEDAERGETRQDRPIGVHRRHPEPAKLQHRRRQPADLRLVEDPKRNLREQWDHHRIKGRD